MRPALELRLRLRPGSARGPVRHLVGAVDRRLLPRWTRPRPYAVDQFLVRLTEAADHSLLWLALAATGASVGGERGRRAAGHGVAALAFTSAVVNGPMKLLIGRRRPPPRRWIRRMPRSSSFPSGHSASASAFAVAATRELPEAGPALLPLAAGVAYSRVYLGVHYPSDVIAGGAIGTAVGSATRSALHKLVTASAGDARSNPRGSSEAVLVVSPHAGHSRGLGRARRSLRRYGIEVAQELAIENVDELTRCLRSETGENRLVVAAGGDGTVGAVAGRLVGCENVLGILPLGTGNDFARAVGIPINPRRAAKTIATGDVAPVDLGRLIRAEQPPTYFAHAATVGLNVDFAKLATRASVRARLGRLTYLAASAYALRERSTFRCVLRHDGIGDDLTLLQLSVISAPVIGGALGLSVRGPQRDGHLLDVLAVEEAPPWKILRAGLLLVLGVQRPVSGVRALQLQTVEVDSEHPLGLAMDGELDGSLPGRFEPAVEAVRVLTPHR